MQEEKLSPSWKRSPHVKSWGEETNRAASERKDWEFHILLQLLKTLSFIVDDLKGNRTPSNNFTYSERFIMLLPIHLQDSPPKCKREV